MRKKLAIGLPFEGNDATRHGDKYEPVAIEKYENLKGVKVIDFSIIPPIDPSEDWLAASPDGITQDGVLIEVKCPFYRMPKDEVPKHYIP